MPDAARPRPPAPAALASAALGLALLAPLPSLAQPMYRCGNTFSQTPCASDARTVTVRPNPVSTPPPGLRGKELCADEVPRQLRLPDPASTRILSVTRQDAEAIQVLGQPQFARKYTVVLNTKNALGAYTGDTPYACYLNETETRVLKFEAQDARGASAPAASPPQSPARP